MSFATEMRKMTQDIAYSREERERAIAGIKEESQQMKAEAQRVKEEAQELVMSLKATRGEESTVLRKELAQQEDQRSREMKKMLRGFQFSRKADGAQMRSELAREMDELKAEVHKLKKDTQNALEDFSSQRERMTEEMQKELSQSRSSIKREVEQHLRNVRKFLQSQQRSRKQAGRQLRKDLAQSKFDIVSEVKQMQDDFNKVQAEIRADLKEAAAIWNNQAHVIGMTGRTKPKKKKEMAVTQVAGREEMPEKPQPRNLEEELLKAIEEQHSGITLSKAAENLGVAPIALGRHSRTLLDKGKIRKAAKLYFPEQVK